MKKLLRVGGTKRATIANNFLREVLDLNHCGVLLGIAAHNPDRAEWVKNRAQLLLEPWAVQAALRRRRGGHRLTDDERNWIRRCTRDPDSLRWPRGTGK